MGSYKRKLGIRTLPSALGWYVLADDGWALLHLPMLSAQLSVDDFETNDSDLDQHLMSLAFDGLTVEYTREQLTNCTKPSYRNLTLNFKQTQRPIVKSRGTSTSTTVQVACMSSATATKTEELPCHAGSGKWPEAGPAPK